MIAWSYQFFTFIRCKTMTFIWRYVSACLRKSSVHGVIVYLSIFRFWLPVQWKQTSLTIQRLPALRYYTSCWICNLIIIIYNFRTLCWHFFAALWRRLLFTDVWEPPIVPRTLSHSFSSRVSDVQHRLCHTAAPPHQPRSPQHQWAETPAFLDGARTHAHVPISVFVTFPCEVGVVHLQWLLFIWHIALPKPKW